MKFGKNVGLFEDPQWGLDVIPGRLEEVLWACQSDLLNTQAKAVRSISILGRRLGHDRDITAAFRVVERVTVLP